jgi:hypothetical protein
MLPNTVMQDCGRQNVNIHFRENFLTVVPDPRATGLIGFCSKITEHAVREKRGSMPLVRSFRNRYPGGGAFLCTLSRLDGVTDDGRRTKLRT